MKIIAQLLLLSAAILSILTFKNYSNDYEALIVVTILIVIFFPLQLLISKFQWNTYNKINKAPIINKKVNWMKVGAFMCSIISILYCLFVILKTEKSGLDALLKVPGVNLGYLLLYSIKKST